MFYPTTTEKTLSNILSKNILSKTALANTRETLGRYSPAEGGWPEHGCEAALCRGAFALSTCKFENNAISDTFVGLQGMLLKRRRDQRCLYRSWRCGGAGVRAGTPGMRCGPSLRKNRWATFQRFSASEHMRKMVQGSRMSSVALQRITSCSPPCLSLPYSPRWSSEGF